MRDMFTNELRFVCSPGYGLT